MAELISVCVCTYKRPKMLADCLKSLAGQKIGKGFASEVIVIDNQEDGGNRAVVEAARRDFPLPLHYVHEPRRGISNARNAAVDAALARGAEWLAFLDDDEVADRNWLLELYRRAKETKADIVGGPVAYTYPPDYPRHLPRLAWRTAPHANNEGGPSSTANVMFSLSALRKLSVELRFDPALTVAEDWEFFSRAAKAGAVFAWNNDAIVAETAVVSRHGLWGCIRRGYNGGKRRAETRGLRVAVPATLRLIAGPVKIILSPFALCFGRHAFMTVAYAGFRTAASGAGALAGLFGAKPNFYHVIDGY